MSYDGRPGKISGRDDGWGELAEARQPGARRKKIAGYLRAANEIRQSYTQSWNRPEDGNLGRDQSVDFTNSITNATGDEQLVLFPSYAKKHVRQKPEARPGSIQEVEGTGRDYRDTVGAGDAEFWKQQWDKYEDDKAIVDVDVRGWVYTPQKGQLNRKQRLMVALARQLVGLSAAVKASPSPSPSSSRASSPSRQHMSRRDEELASQQAEEIIRKGETEAAFAGQGRFSEQPSKDSDNDSLYDDVSQNPRMPARQAIGASLGSGSQSDLTSKPAQVAMTAAELAVANENLMTRLRPFMANPAVNTAVNAFFYNETTSRQKTVMTDSYGHFSFRAGLDFVPTHVRVLAMEHLSIQEPVEIVGSSGVSLISDVDDTVRHSAVTRGAREIFRNAFIRNLNELGIQGVKQWYGKMVDMGVQLHYVSNSPWQLFPVLTSFFSAVGLPKGSFHLKQYSGMLQGIFEPVAERKKATLDRILRDFPERRFLLVGDSGEADLEVYTDVVQEHPGRILGVFIRDVATTTPTGGFFDPTGPISGASTPKGGHSRNGSVDRQYRGSRVTSAEANREKQDMDRAIAMSLRDMENGRQQQSAGEAKKDEIGDLIDFGDEETTPKATQTTFARQTPAVPKKPRALASPPPIFEAGRPPPPSKPSRLRSASSVVTKDSKATADIKSKPAPPLRSSTGISTTSTRSSTSSAPYSDNSGYDRSTYRGYALQKLSAAYNAIPPASSLVPGHRPGAYDPPAPASRPSDMRAASSTASDPDRSRFTAGARPQPSRTSTLASMGSSAIATGARLGSYWTGQDLGGASAGSNAGGSSEGAGGGSSGSGAGPQQQQGVNKREEMWKRRWRRAKEVLDKDGVVLRTWRVGADVQDECVRLVQGELDKVARGAKKV